MNKVLKISTDILLPVLFIFSSYAQTYSDVLDNYAPIGLHGSLNYYNKGKTYLNQKDSPVIIYYLPFLSYGNGISIRFLRKNNFTLYTGVYNYFLQDLIYYYIEKSQISDFSYNEILINTNGSDFLWAIPFKIEYLFYKKYFGFAAIKFGYYKEYGQNSLITFDKIKIYEITKPNNNWFHFDMEIGLGKYYTTRFFLFQPYIYYNQSFVNLWKGNIFIEGITHKPYTTIEGIFERSGSFIGLGLNLYPVKFWNNPNRRHLKQMHMPLSDDFHLPKHHFGFQIGFLGLWSFYEKRLYKNIFFRAEFGYAGGIKRRIFYFERDYMFLMPFLTLEPRWYYRLIPSLEGANITKSGYYLALNFNYIPNGNYITITSFLKKKMYFKSFSVIPIWGIKKNFSSKFHYELGGGIGYIHVFYDYPKEFNLKPYDQESIRIKVNLRIGFNL